MESTNSSTDPETVRNVLPLGFRIVATVFILAGLFALYQFLTATPENLFVENYQPFILRDINSFSEKKLVEAYKGGSAEEVIQVFDLIKEPGPDDFFLVGNAWLAMQDFEKSYKAFENLSVINRSQNTHFFEEDSEYYLALSYLAAHQIDKALQLFEKIRSNVRHSYYKKISPWFIIRVRHTLQQTL